MSAGARSTVAVALIAFAGILAGCATGARPEAMVADAVAVAHPTGSDVSVAVSGGKATSSTGASQISDDAFAQALRDSIAKSKLFSAIATSGGRYRLTAFIGKVDQPMIGFSLTVKMEVSYALLENESKKTVWAKNIDSEYTAGVGAAFAAVERLRLATEGAAKANIQAAIAEMAALQL